MATFLLAARYPCPPPCHPFESLPSQGQLERGCAISPNKSIRILIPEKQEQVAGLHNSDSLCHQPTVEAFSVGTLLGPFVVVTSNHPSLACGLISRVIRENWTIWHTSQSVNDMFFRWLSEFEPISCRWTKISLGEP